MADYGKKTLGIYSANCEKIRRACSEVPSPIVGGLVFFSEANKPESNHIGLIYKVTGSTLYTVEGDTTLTPGLIANGDCVATKSYSKLDDRILSYGRPNYRTDSDRDKVIDVAIQEVGYREKKSDSNLNSKLANAGQGNFTKYGKWINVNGATWSGSFICWCFSAALDSSFSGVIGNDITEDIQSKIFVNQSQSNSSLAGYVNRLTIGQQGYRSSKIECITIHIAKKVGDIHDLAVMLNSSEKCYNYGIDNTGLIGLFVDEIMWTDSSNSKQNDSRSVNIICMNQTLEPDYTISEACYNSLVKLCEDICRRNFIFELKSTDHPDIDTITFHYQFNDKCECPGPYMTEQAIPKLIKEVNANIGAVIDPVTGAVTTKAKLASSQTESLKAQSTISIKSIKPYVVQPSRTALNVDYKTLKELGVVGVMLDAGEHFDNQHNVVNYRTETIYKQTEEVKYANLPHAYIYTTRARTVREVKDEAYWFRFIVSKYPPKLGVWLHCNFDTKQEVAETLVDEWYKYFVNWGLKSKCGIYATLSQSKLIGWPRQCAYMPLWLEGSMTSNVCPDEELLTPSFFKLDNLTNKSGDISSVIAGDVAPEDIEPEKAEKVRFDDYTEVIIPNNVNYFGRKGWQGLASITKQNAQAYKITHDPERTVDTNGLCKLDNRFLIDIGSGISSTVGTYLDLFLVNGTKIECIVGNIEPDVETDRIDHIFTTTDATNYTCGKFIIVNKDGVINPDIRRFDDCSYADPSWESPIKTIRVYAGNWFTE